MVAHSKKARPEASPISPEKHNHFNGIPEEDEEEANQEEGDENDDSLIKKGECSRYKLRYTIKYRQTSLIRTSTI